MRKYAKIVLLVVGGMMCAGLVKAQYPTIPDSIKERIESQTAKWKQHNDSVWKLALPIVMQEAENGRPYRPWAARPSDLPQASIPAFPGAEGGGAYTPGGRGGKVYVVTSLADSGRGTFREACEAGGARIIVFNVAGVIRLKSPISLKAPYVTIAGQTAPGDGVCITGASFHIDTHDVIIRYMRFRRGEMDVAYRDDALGGNAVGNIIIDHCSCTWGLDENISLYRHMYQPEGGGKSLKLPTVNITIQNTISAEALDTYNHAFGSTLGGHHTLFARNLFANNVSRNSSVGMDGDFNFVNNVVYNWWNRTIDGGDHNSQYNIIGNYFKPGPITPVGKPISYRIIKPEAGRSEDSRKLFGRAYVHGNIVERNETVTLNNWDGGVQPAEGGTLEEIRVEYPMNLSQVTLLTADSAYRHVLAHVGATLPVRDAVDERIIRCVKYGIVIHELDAESYIVSTPYVKRRLSDYSYKKGIITNPEQVGGLPLYEGIPVVDSDNDGMADEWEVLHGLNPYNSVDATWDRDSDGYTNIEEYINSFVE